MGLTNCGAALAVGLTSCGTGMHAIKVLMMHMHAVRILLPVRCGNPIVLIIRRYHTEAVYGTTLYTHPCDYRSRCRCQLVLVHVHTSSCRRHGPPIENSNVSHNPLGCFTFGACCPCMGSAPSVIVGNHPLAL